MNKYIAVLKKLIFLNFNLFADLFNIATSFKKNYSYTFIDGSDSALPVTCNKGRTQPGNIEKNNEKKVVLNLNLFIFPKTQSFKI